MNGGCAAPQLDESFKEQTNSELALFQITMHQPTGNRQCGFNLDTGTLAHTLKREAVRRLEVISGTGRRRLFSADDKARIIEETLAPGERGDVQLAFCWAHVRRRFYNSPSQAPR